ncbi:MAG: hypothetical protein JSR76_02035 [Verrucomicrobia bacterium]|nr:hypothetical protein [Verrucomicrobiota bacterium]
MAPIFILGSFADSSAAIIPYLQGGYIESYTLEGKDGVEKITTTTHFSDLGDCSTITKRIRLQTLALLRERHLDPAAKACREPSFLPDDIDLLDSLVAAAPFSGEMHPSTLDWKVVSDICLLKETNIDHKCQIARARGIFRREAFSMTLADLDKAIEDFKRLVGREITIYIRLKKESSPGRFLTKMIVCRTPTVLPKPHSLPAHAPWKNPLGKLLPR